MSAALPPPSSPLSTNAAWMVLGRFGQRALGLVNTIVLARLLVPEDFGLVALATSVAVIIEVFGQFNFDLALIRDQNATRAHYDTAWTLNILRGLILGVVLLAAAEPIAWFFAEPRLSPVIMCLAIRPLIEGFYNIGIVDFRKHMMMHREFWLFLVSKLASLFLVIPLAYLWRSYWALIVGIISEQLVRLLLSYLLHKFRPRFDLTKWRELFGFSKWLLGSAIVVAIGNRMDTFAVGKWGTPHEVGIYNISYEIASLPTTELVWPIARAVFPAYAKIAANTSAITAAYLRSLAIILGIASPLACGIAVTSDLLVPIIFGEKWLAAIPIIQILAVFGLARVFLSTDGPLLIAMNRPKTLAVLDASEIILLRIPLLLVAMAWFGIVGVAATLVATYSIRTLVNQIIIGRLLRVSLVARLAVVWRTIIANAAMVGAVWLMQKNWPYHRDVVGLLVEAAAVVLVGAAVFSAALLVLWRLSRRPEGFESFMLAHIKRVLSRFKASRQPLQD
jgi:lipopolysaccharide exporter